MGLMINKTDIAKDWIERFGMLEQLVEGIEKVRAMGLTTFKVGVEKYVPELNLYRAALYFEGYEETDREENGYMFLTTLQEDQPGTAEKAFEAIRIEFDKTIVDGVGILTGLTKPGEIE